MPSLSYSEPTPARGLMATEREIPCPPFAVLASNYGVFAVSMVPDIESGRTISKACCLQKLPPLLPTPLLTKDSACSNKENFFPQLVFLESSHLPCPDQGIHPSDYLITCYFLFRAGMP